jgi:exopolysaccharide production protein ExoZ
MSKLVSIEFLRGVAALMVLHAHLKFPILDACGADSLPAFLRPVWGACGVDLFFVISGFVIALSCDRPGTNWRGFLTARLSRIVPIYALFSLVCLATPVFRNVPATADVIANSFLYLPLFNDGAFAGTLHPYGWTLSFEMGFYLVAALVVAAAGRRAPEVLFAIFGLGPIALFAISPEPGSVFLRFLLSPLAIEFALGIIAYRIVSQKLPRLSGGMFLVAGLVGFGIGFGRTEHLASFTDVLARGELALERVVCWGLPAFLVVVGFAAVERRIESQSRKWPLAGVCSFFGEISFTLYLVQPVAFVLVTRICEVAGWNRPWLVAAVLVAAIIGMAHVIRQVVEKPLTSGARAGLERLLKRNPESVSDQGTPGPASRSGASTPAGMM